MSSDIIEEIISAAFPRKYCSFCSNKINVKKQEEKIKLNFTSSNTEEYNSMFNITELKDAIAVSKDKATGPDDIHY